MQRIRPHLTYANVMVTLLAFVVLGGVAVAATTLPANSVGNKQLKKNSVGEVKIREGAVTGAKVKDGSLTGADIVASTLGTVPFAERAGSATSAGTASSADAAKSAETATTADSASTAANATTADDAAELGGEPPSAYASSSRFFYVTVDPASATPEGIFTLPGQIKITTDGNADADAEFEIGVENSGPDNWLLVGPSLEETVGPGASGVVTLTPQRTLVVILQKRDEPAKAVALQCGLTVIPPRITCFATLSPALTP